MGEPEEGGRREKEALHLLDSFTINLQSAGSLPGICTQTARLIMLKMSAQKVIDAFLNYNVDNIDNVIINIIKDNVH